MRSIVTLVSEAGTIGFNFKSVRLGALGVQQLANMLFQSGTTNDWEIWLTAERETLFHITSKDEETLSSWFVDNNIPLDLDMWI